MNNRRRLIVALGAASLTARTVFAQAKKPLAVIGWLNSGSAKTGAHVIAAFGKEWPSWVGAKARSS